MLKAPKLSNPSPSIPFLPRQIMLASAAAVAAAVDEEVVLTKRKKEKKEKKRKEKNSSGTLELDIVVADGVSKKGQCRDAVLRSIAAFLESNGFPRTLSTLQSEAGIEFSNEKTSAVNLEDLLCKFLETSNDPAEKAAIGWIQDQDLGKSNASVEAVEKNVNNIAEEYPKKKRKNTDQSSKNKLEEGCPQSVNLGEITDEASDDFQVKDSTNLRENGDIKKLKPSSNLDADTKEKKRKKKSASESLTENSDVKQLDGTVGISDSADLNLGNPCESKKENKKRKHKKSSDVPTENAEIDDHGKLKELQSVTDGSSERKDKIKKKKEKKAKDVQPEVTASTTENNTNDKLVEAEKSTLSAVERPLNDKDSKRKEKKTKHKLTPEGLMDPEKSFDANKSDTQQDVQGSDLANTGTLATVDTDAKVGKKSSKKRKRATSEEERDNTQTDNSQIVNMKTDETNADAEQRVLTKKMKKEEGNESENLSLVTNSEKEVCEQMANGGVVDDKGEAGDLSKETKKDKKSKEPKSITPFQRVKIDEVKFADHRLKDNSYWAKGGADSGYGAKAQEVLGQVRGRDFRHEKTKKKRGTYRGGLIDLQSHSIKFTYSDEE